MDLSFFLELSGVQWAYMLVVLFLFVLAVIDLWVGVSNDAVNFIGSAVGARAAKLKHILMVAAAGVFIGAAFSNGMMEVARSGIFNPSEFYFSEVMCIFLAVMVSDVFLLDLFNSLGLPTSTTVSMVFELLGAAFIIAIIKMASENCRMELYRKNRAVNKQDSLLELQQALELPAPPKRISGIRSMGIPRVCPSAGIPHSA